MLKKEFESRTNYILEFKRILVQPLPKVEVSLHRIYSSIVKEMEQNARKLRRQMQLIESVLNQLEGPERNVMYFRYIQGIEWIDMPEYMIYEQRTCQLFETKALDKILEMDIDWSDENAN